MLLEKVKNAFETFTGIMKNEQIDHIAFTMPDTEDDETSASVSIIKSYQCFMESPNII